MNVPKEDIRVEITKTSAEGWELNVRVGALGSTKHAVVLSKKYYEQLAKDRNPQQLVQDSFLFLLERESKEAILPSFNLSDIQKYFPDYEGSIVSN